MVEWQNIPSAVDDISRKLETTFFTPHNHILMTYFSPWVFNVVWKVCW